MVYLRKVLLFSERIAKINGDEKNTALKITSKPKNGEMKMSHKPYLVKPGMESCYEYLLNCHEKISADVGDYDAFVNVDCPTKISEMINDVEKLAAFLVKSGFKKGDVLTAFLPTSPHAFVIFYAFSKIGVITDFVHPLTPPDALAEQLKLVRTKGIFILDRSAAKYADVIKDYFTVICSVSDFTTGKIKEAVMADEAKCPAVPEGDNIHFFKDILAGDFGTVPTIKNPGKDPAIYLHGSGTTGRSKTVILSSFALNSAAYGSYYYDVNMPFSNGGAYNLCILPCFHSFGVSTGIHYCSCVGIAGIIMPKFDAHKANDYISRYKVQYISGAPSMFMKMMAEDNFKNDGLKNLVAMYSGGDIVSEQFLADFNKALAENGSNANIFRGWGLTEMCGVCTTNNSEGHKPESIGRPLTGMVIKSIDEDGNDLPAGVNGELCVCNDSIMNGYLPDGEVTESGIYTDKDGKQWIHTGDMGYVDEDGFVFFTGRKKRIIIISAYNIYPYTIEQKVMTLPFIDEACAVQGYGDDKKPLVKLCVTLKDKTMNEDDAKAKILEFCQNNLNSFSVPRKIVIMDAMPRTKMAKLDFLAMTDPLPEGC